MKYPQVLAFVRIARLGSIRAAARSMGVSQAAVTRTLRTFEEDIGAMLVSRGVRGVALTAAGLSLLPRAALIVEQMERLAHDVSEDERGSVVFGASPIASATLLAHALPAFIAQRPHAPLRIVEGFLTTVLPGLRDGTLDFGICAAHAPTVSRFFSFEPWFRSKAAFIARRNHPLVGRPCTRAELSRYRWIHTGPIDAGADSYRSNLAERGLEDPTIIESQNLVATSVLLKCTDSVAIAPHALTAHHIVDPEIALLDVSEPLPEMTVGLLMRSDVHLTPNAQTMATLLRDAVDRVPGLIGIR
ncbi:MULTISPECIES: LysR family transcriptional regulator [Paraburkholderia]|uniref:LysR family transcriptional regulator n=1 Tax=Paraburkholderia TaxID=1822464 RepID=UPI00224E9E6A|nr:MULTISPECIES: LysR substrate-binding domain-containing protein [Paraburkholderia]MCX4163670.1 LysR substrate-binding domain-containing protein [Paraburkholderia megapolitana]MDN7159165.1 LysR substrate-binding domain-containing protein [Paraburkholderia sp. CHISQ3]MDQ6496212.1 LysR substrate-binding domain-containing protein [Paraburkholderia megapolitana]